jgi:hypothetical protein
MKQSALVVLGLCVAGVALMALVKARHSVAPASSAVGSASLREGTDVPLANEEPARAPPRQPSSRPAPLRVRDPKLVERRQQADEARRRILELSRSPRPVQAAPRSGAPTMPALEGGGNQADKPLGEYVNHVLQQQFNPIATSCYEELLSRDKTAAGTLILNVKVVGDTRVGGVVQEVEIQPESTIADAELRLCMRESMFATVFDAPPGGEGELTFTYPVDVAP